MLTLDRFPRIPLAHLPTALEPAPRLGAAVGLPKLWVIRQALAVRRDHPESFGPRGLYEPLYARGARSGHVVAARRGDDVVVVVPRLTVRLGGDWADTSLELPGGGWRNVLTGDEVDGGNVRVGDLLRRFPVALLERPADAA